jgi:NADH:ubiquinone oxidoreductase subunit F (NADH-binding)
MATNLPICSLTIVTLLWLEFSPASAQMTQPTGAAAFPRGATSNYHFAQSNELTIVVSLLGEIRVPGRYEISRSINLLDLIALAGGWTDRSKPSDITITRLIQAGAKVERTELKVDLSDFTQVSEDYLSLEQGDIISVGRSSSLTFGDVALYVSTAAAVATTVFVILNYQNTR